MPRLKGEGGGGFFSPNRDLGTVQELETIATVVTGKYFPNTVASKALGILKTWNIIFLYGRKNKMNWNGILYKVFMQQDHQKKIKIRYIPVIDNLMQREQRKCRKCCALL